MIRYKIIGTRKFAINNTNIKGEINSDIGNFFIGKSHNLKINSEEIKIPPQLIWIRHEIIYTPCEPTVVIKNSNKNAVWNNNNERCSTVEIIPNFLIDEQDKWDFSKIPVKINFQNSSTIYTNEELGFHLWPCGGRIDNKGDPNSIEQLYVEPPLDLNLKNMHITTLKQWQELNLNPEKPGIYKGQKVFFYPPHPKQKSLSDLIKNGFLEQKIKTEKDFFFTYKSKNFKNLEKNIKTLDILFERQNI